MEMTVEKLASAVGKGLFAGVVGTSAMTLVSTAEMKLRDRRGSQTPAEAICRLLGVEALGEKEKTRLTNLVHWGYGSGLGILRGLVAVAGLDGASAAAVFFGVVWAGEVVSLPAIDVAPPITEWGAEAIASDLANHLVYAIVTSVAYELMDREESPRSKAYSESHG